MIETAATRRDTLRLAAIVAGSLAVPAFLRPAVVWAQDDEADLEDFLELAVDLEQATVVAYETAAEAKDVDAELRRILETFRDHEQEHANALRTALESLGVDPPDPPASAADSEALGGLDDLESADDHLEFLVDLEQEQLELYLGRAPVFESEDLVRTSAEIAACQAQHVVVLNQALGSPPADSVPELASDAGE